MDGASKPQAIAEARTEPSREHSIPVKTKPEAEII